jgi:hypothetical protein
MKHQCYFCKEEFWSWQTIFYKYSAFYICQLCLWKNNYLSECSYKLKECFECKKLFSEEQAQYYKTQSFCPECYVKYEVLIEEQNNEIIDFFFEEIIQLLKENKDIRNRIINQLKK